MSLAALSEVAISEADVPRHLDASIAFVLDDSIVSIKAISPNFPDVFGSVGAGGGKSAKGWAWIGGKMVYGTEADLQRALAEYEAEQRRLAEPPPPRKVKKAKKLRELERVEAPVVVPVIDYLSAPPNMEALYLQQHLDALAVQLRELERQDEELLVDIVTQQERQQVLAVLNLVEQVL